MNAPSYLLGRKLMESRDVSLPTELIPGIDYRQHLQLRAAVPPHLFKRACAAPELSENEQ